MAITPFRSSTDPFGSMLDDFFRPTQGWGGRMSEMMRSPDADVVETENEIRVMVELPGMRTEDIDIDLENNVLTISGEKREERREGGENDRWHLSERRYGRFARSFILPRDVDQEQIQARFEEGVLNVTIPKSEKARRRRIEIQGGDGARRVESRSGSRGA